MLVEQRFAPRLLAFCCEHCAYAGADLAGLNRLNYPENVRILPVPCCGRVDPAFVLRALQRGADGVLVCGCHPGDCHFVSGNYFGRRRLLLFKGLLEFSGLEAERFQLHWVSATEAAKFRDIIVEVTEQLRALGPNYKFRLPGPDGEKGGDGYA